MIKFWNWLSNLYVTNAKFRGLVQAIEAGAFGGVLMATANGFDFSKKGLVSFVAAILAGIGAAIRNYLVNRPGQPAVPLPPVAPPIPPDVPKI